MKLTISENLVYIKYFIKDLVIKYYYIIIK